MVTETTASSNSQQILFEINEIDELIDAAKKQDAKTTTAQMDNLLNEYILAQMKGDTEGAKDIQDKINTLISTYGNDLEKANELKEKMKQIENNPADQTASESAYLQGLIATLQQDATTGNLSNL